MPYIKQTRRIELGTLRDGVFEIPQTAGELNYLFTQMALAYISTWHTDYQKINDVLGALEGAKLEFYRRIVVPYEQKKIEENGDIDGYENI